MTNTTDTNPTPTSRTRRLDLKSGEFPLLEKTDEQSIRRYLEDVYSYAISKANDAIDWYLVKKNPKRFWAQTTRLFAIMFTTLGGLAPLIVASKVLPKIGEVDISQIGFILLAAAAACVALDKFFGFSSAWIRYLTTATILQNVLQEFYLDWAALTTSQAASASTQTDARLKRIQTFLMRVRAEVEKETADWAAEYRSNLAEMEKSARQQLEANRPGSVSIMVPNVAQSTGGVAVLLDGASVQMITAPDCLLSPVFPGDHLVTIRGTIQGKPVSASQQVRVEAGRTQTLELKLPQPSP